MAEDCEMLTQVDHLSDESSQSDAVTKFMNGEISFGDYLQQMDDQVSISNSSCEKPVDVAPPIDTLSIGTLDDIELSASSGTSCSENDESTDNLEGRKKKKTSTKKKRPQRSKLSATLRAVMGQANVCYAKGDAESAVKMCLEIIKEEPNASEPFRTLSSIYDGIGEADKSLQMRLIAAHLGPTDKEEWVQLADILKGEQRYRQAVSCCTRAISLDLLNVSLYEKRIELMKLGHLGNLEDYGYQRLLHKLNPKTDGPTVIRIRNIVGTLYYKDKKFDKACEIWKYLFTNCEELITKNEVELYTDALVCNQMYDECLSIFCKFCGISVIKQCSNGVEIIADTNICNDIQTKIRIKLALCLIHYHSYAIARSQIKIFLKEDPDQFGQLFYDIASKLIDDGMYLDALPLLNRLSESKMNSSDIWFKITLCYKNLKELEQCFQSYRTAINLFPDDNDLKLKFCNELKSAGLYNEAVEITLKDQSNISLMIYERCQLYHLLKDYDAFIEAALQLFRLHYIEINSIDEFTLFESLFQRSAKGVKGKLMQHLNGTDVDHSVSLEDEWQVFIKVCNLYLQRKNYDLFQQLACSLYLSFKFLPKRPELRLVLTLACIYNHDYELGFDLTRPVLLQSEVPKRAWNLFYLASCRTEYSRLHKFLIRTLIKNPNDSNALMLYANNCLFSGTYKYALNDYYILYERFKTPLLSFMIALNLLHIACQKFITSKHALVTQMLAFFTKYQEHRGSEASQEVFYNIGRAFHQLELLPQAIFYYKKALTYKSAIDDRMFDLTPDIAFNLHLIYMNAGQFDLAKTYLEKYIVI
ncbi:hypothetical protein V9T40_004136 [Parthenolecanium corni]|uniref:General transcription factor 3C polypeptide 3 n=1 Tax=Parthenolecanium corni TaxID=536013 RepID=A0AAN9TEB3_9HEMI